MNADSDIRMDFMQQPVMKQRRVDVDAKSIKPSLEGREEFLYDSPQRVRRSGSKVPGPVIPRSVSQNKATVAEITPEAFHDTRQTTAQKAPAKCPGSNKPVPSSPAAGWSVPSSPAAGYSVPSSPAASRKRRSVPSSPAVSIASRKIPSSPAVSVASKKTRPLALLKSPGLASLRSPGLASPGARRKFKVERYLDTSQKMKAAANKRKESNAAAASSPDTAFSAFCRPKAVNPVDTKLQEEIKLCVEQFKPTPDELDRLIVYCGSKLKNLSEPKGRLMDIANSLIEEISQAVTLRENLFVCISGPIKSGKKLLIGYALERVQNITRVYVNGRENGAHVLSQVLCNLDPCATCPLDSYEELQKWFRAVVIRRARQKKTIVLIIDNFEVMFNSDKAMDKNHFLYTFFDDMHKKDYKLVFVCLTRDGQWQKSFEGRLRSRIHGCAKFLPVRIPVQDEVEEIVQILESHLLQGDDAPEEFSSEFKESYNKLARLRIREYVNHEEGMKFIQNESNELIRKMCARVWPIDRLINGEYEDETPGPLDYLGEPELLICIAMTKMHGRVQISFNRILWELKPILTHPSYVHIENNDDFLLAHYQTMMARGIIKKIALPGLEKWSPIPKKPSPAELSPVHFRFSDLMRRHIDDLKRAKPSKNNPLTKLPSAVVEWSKAY